MPQAALAPHVQEALIDIVRRAGAAILEIYQSDFAVTAKDDDSPLTQADLAAHRIIVAGLEALEPHLPIISEESRPPPFSERPSICPSPCTSSSVWWWPWWPAPPGPVSPAG